MRDDADDAQDAKGTDPFTENDAAYVMGALTTEDRLAFEAHLPGCPDCTRSVRELSGVTDLLDKVPLARVVSPQSHPNHHRTSCCRA